jgi:biotin synthase
MNLTQILEKDHLTKSDIEFLLGLTGDDMKILFKRAHEIRLKYCGHKVYFRGLIEYSNICMKNCYYCGIRHDCTHLNRYTLTDEEVIEAGNFAYKENYGSIVLQSGEISSPAFIERIEALIQKIKNISDGKLGITLSLGEQSLDTYKRWFDAGAHRYLLRIEASNRLLYAKLHPEDDMHDYDERLQALHDIKKAGFQLGTGVMIGLPYQTISDLADDILFMQELDIDMCGMGPYIEHKETPLYKTKDTLMPLKDRIDLTFKMLSVLRIVMKDINMAATTALQAIDPIGREKALQIGANIIMPNITPGKYRDEYKLYENKPCTDENPADCKTCLEARIKFAGSEIGYGEWGDSQHFKKKKNAT